MIVIYMEYNVGLLDESFQTFSLKAYGIYEPHLKINKKSNTKVLQVTI